MKTIDKNNENQLTKILDESALKDKMTAKRMLSIGYIVLSQSPRALNRVEGIIQKIHKVLDQVSIEMVKYLISDTFQFQNDEEVVVAASTLFAILSEQECYQQNIVNENVPQLILKCFTKAGF